MAEKTALYEQHLTWQAEMVCFAGWELPIHYGSTLDEHHAVRQHAGLFDVSHMTVIDLIGANLTDFLRYLLLNDIAKLSSHKAQYTCLLNHEGGILDDCLIYPMGPSSARLVSNAATREKVLAWLEQHAATFAVSINYRENFSMLAIQGPQARKLMMPILPEVLQYTSQNLKPFEFAYDNLDGYFVARTGYTGEDGIEVILPNTAAATLADQCIANGIKPCGLGARDTLRLEAGLNLYGSDMTEANHPDESNLSWVVDLKDTARDFIGRSAIEEYRQQGIATQLVGLVLRDKGVLRGQQQVVLPDDSLGITTSGGFAPSLSCSIALARIPMGKHSSCQVKVRGKYLNCQIIKPPFIKAGKATFDK